MEGMTIDLEKHIDFESGQDVVQTSTSFPSLDTNGVQGVSAQIQRRLVAVKRMELPQDMETMRSFLGLVNSTSTDLVLV